MKKFGMLIVAFALVAGSRAHAEPLWWGTSLTAQDLGLDPATRPTLQLFVSYWDGVGTFNNWDSTEGVTSLDLEIPVDPATSTSSVGHTQWSSWVSSYTSDFDNYVVFAKVFYGTTMPGFTKGDLIGYLSDYKTMQELLDGEYFSQDNPWMLNGTLIPASPIPEPGTGLLAALGLATLGMRRRRARG